MDIVIALIYRTAYPFKGIIAEHSNKRIQEFFWFFVLYKKIERYLDPRKARSQFAYCPIY